MISQTALQNFQEEMGKVMRDPYKVSEYDSEWFAVCVRMHVSECECECVCVCVCVCV